MGKSLSFLFLFCLGILGTMAAHGDYSSPFENGTVSASFDENVGLFGDSKLVSESCSIQMTDSVSGSEGRVVCKKPIKLFQGKERRNNEYFSTYFSFTMPNEISDVLAFVMVPSSFDLSLFGKKDNSSSALGFLFQYAKTETVVAFEFEICKTGNNNARILIGRPESAQIQHLSFVGNLMMDYRGMLRCMIEYNASSKRMFVRFRKSGSIKEIDPFFSFSVDLAKLWEDGEFIMGLSSANGKNSSKPHFLYSWGFEIKHLPPMWMHSEPLEPKEVNAQVSTNEGRGRSECVWRVLGALVLGLVCAVLGAISALYLWTTCGVRRSVVVVPEECAGSIVVVAIEQANK